MPKFEKPARAGATPAEEERPAYSRCKIDANGERCWFPGSIHIGVLSPTNETGVCRLHYGSPAHVTEAVIEESLRWRDAMRELRAVPVTYRRHDGVEVPGYTPLWQREEIASRSAPAAGAQPNAAAVRADVRRAAEALSGKKQKRQREPGEDDE